MRDPRAYRELLTPGEMSRADRFAIGAGTPGIALMERAGLAVADEAARLAKSRGYAVELGLLGRREALKGDPALAAARYQGPVLDADALDLARADCVIDALFGAGLARDIDGEAKAIIERINAFRCAGGLVLAVDVPSGIDGETGKIRGVAVEASASVTFFRLKPGHLLLPGRTLAGVIHLVDIGIPEAALTAIAPQAFINAPAVSRGSAACRRGEPQICPRRSAGPVGLGPPHGRRPARRSGGIGRWRRHCQCGQPARRGCGQFRASHRRHDRALRERNGVRGAARR